VIVYKLNASSDRNRIINSSGGREATASGKKYYKTNGGGGLYFASDRLIVVARIEATLTNLLQKDDSTIVISDDMRSAAKSADGTVAMANVGQAAEGADILGLMSFAGNAGMGPVFGPGAGPPRGPKARSTVFSVRVSGNRGTGKIESTYDNPETARSVAEGVKRAIEQNRASMTEVESYDVSQSGSTVTLTTRGTVKRGRTMFPFGGGKL
jgi:hypothetical protein